MTSPRTTRLACILTLLAAGAGAVLQAQARRLPPGAAMLGQVVDAGSGRGVDRAVVTVLGNGARRRMLTDRRGRFLATGLPAGVYAVSAERSGYLQSTFGQRRPDGDGQTLTLAAGQWMADIDLAITRPAVVSGLVLDERGEPWIDVGVAAFRRTWDTGSLSLDLVAEARTDDRGTYRFATLIPGDHLIAATAPGTLPEYYPGSTSVAGASIVTAPAGREVTGINFLLARRPTAAIAGRIDLASVPDDTADRIQIRLLRPGDPFAVETPHHRVVAATRPAPDGTFAFEDVPLGDYALEASLADLTPPQQFWARRTVRIDEDADDVTMALEPGLEITGHVRVVTQSRAAVVLPETVRVALHPIAPSPEPLAAHASVDASGGFATGATLRPERYRLQLLGVPDGLRVDSIVADGRDVADEGLDLALGPPITLVVTLTDRRTLITGMVRGAGALGDPSAAVLVFPADARPASDRNVRHVRVARDGGFALPDLPPGRYALVAIDDAGSAGWRDPSRLQRWRPRATVVTLRTGEAAVVELRRLPL